MGFKRKFKVGDRVVSNRRFRDGDYEIPEGLKGTITDLDYPSSRYPYYVTWDDEFRDVTSCQARELDHLTAFPVGVRRLE